MTRALLIAVAIAALSACGPAYAPPNAPATACPTISSAEYQAAIEDGAARGQADVKADGSVWLTNGPGIKHCATYNSAMKPCRRPSDYVIEYKKPDGEVFYVHVPAKAEYRFNVHKAPNTCEIVKAAP